MPDSVDVAGLTAAYMEARKDTDDVPISFKLIVQAPKGTKAITTELVALVRARLLEILDEEDNAELAVDRITIDAGIPTVQEVRMFYENEQRRIPEEIRDYVRHLAAQLPEKDRVDIAKLNFAVDTWDNGVFFVDYPDLLLRDGLVLRWDDVFGDDNALTGDLSEWTADLTDAFGPLSEGSALVIDMDTLESKMEYGE